MTASRRATRFHRLRFIRSLGVILVMVRFSMPSSLSSTCLQVLRDSRSRNPCFPPDPSDLFPHISLAYFQYGWTQSWPESSFFPQIMARCGILKHDLFFSHSSVTPGPDGQHQIGFINLGELFAFRKSTCLFLNHGKHGKHRKFFSLHSFYSVTFRAFRGSYILVQSLFSSLGKPVLLPTAAGLVRNGHFRTAFPGETAQR